MTPFDDVAYPLALGRDASVSPEFSTSVALTASGHERRNALWSDARLRFDVGPGIRSEKELGTLIAFFRARHGPARGFRLRDPFDFSSRGMTGAPTAFDQVIATGDGLASEFALIKTYDEQVRRITRPVKHRAKRKGREHLVSLLLVSGGAQSRHDDAFDIRKLSRFADGTSEAFSRHARRR